jgi:hypothetical protein
MVGAMTAEGGNDSNPAFGTRIKSVGYIKEPCFNRALFVRQPLATRTSPMFSSPSAIRLSQPNLRILNFHTYFGRK